MQGRSSVDGTTTAPDRSDAVQAPERAVASTLADPISEESRAPLGVVIKDRRRLGRVIYHSQNLIDLLRGRSAVVELPAVASDGTSEESPLAPGAKRTGDGLSAARGTIFSTLTGAGLWVVIIWILWRLL